MSHLTHTGIKGQRLSLEKTLFRGQKAGGGGVLGELRDIQKNAELPRPGEDTISGRSGWS